MHWRAVLPAEDIWGRAMYLSTCANAKRTLKPALKDPALDALVVALLHHGLETPSAGLGELHSGTESSSLSSISETDEPPRPTRQWRGATTPVWEEPQSFVPGSDPAKNAALA